MSSYTWDSFWKDQRQSFNEMMRINTAYFCEKLSEKIEIENGAEVLDYGCGPGFLVDCLKPGQLSITGADINDFFLDECRRKHPSSLFVKIETDLSVNWKIFHEALKDKKFDFIILLSITQYFKDLRELEDVITFLLRYTKIGGKIILADIVDSETSSLKDAWFLFLHCLRKGKVSLYFGFISYLLFSEYRKISQNVKLLTISRESLNQIANNNKLDLMCVMGLTIQVSRKNYVMTRRL